MRRSPTREERFHPGVGSIERILGVDARRNGGLPVGTRVRSQVFNAGCYAVQAAQGIAHSSLINMPVCVHAEHIGSHLPTGGARFDA